MSIVQGMWGGGGGGGGLLDPVVRCETHVHVHVRNMQNWSLHKCELWFEQPVCEMKCS